MRETAVGRRLSPALEATIMRALSREPVDRHPAIRAFADDLQRASAEGAPTVPRGGPAAPEEGAGGGLLGSLKSLFQRKREG
jgi:hypothetical protein